MLLKRVNDLYHSIAVNTVEVMNLAQDASLMDSDLINDMRVKQLISSPYTTLSLVKLLTVGRSSL